jgi:hypothetical protein
LATGIFRANEGGRVFLCRRLRVVNLITVPEIERFLQLGLIGRFDLAPEEVLRRRMLARAEVENVMRVLQDEPMGTQIGLVADTVPKITFQLFRNQNQTSLAISPFRLGEQPNVRIGVAMVTAAEEPVRLYERLAEDLWKRAQGRRRDRHSASAASAIRRRYRDQAAKRVLIDLRVLRRDRGPSSNALASAGIRLPSGSVLDCRNWGIGCPRPKTRSFSLNSKAWA